MRFTDFALTLGHRPGSLLLLTKESEPIVTDATEIRVTRSPSGGFECEVTRPGTAQPVRAVAAALPARYSPERANGWLRSETRVEGVTPDGPPPTTVVCPAVNQIAAGIRDEFLRHDGAPDPPYDVAEISQKSAVPTGNPVAERPHHQPRSNPAMSVTQNPAAASKSDYISSLSLDELRKRAKAADKPVVPDVEPSTIVVHDQASPQTAETESNIRGVAALFGCVDRLSPAVSPDELRKRIATEELRKLAVRAESARPTSAVDFDAHVSAKGAQDLINPFESGPKAPVEASDELFFPQPARKPTASRQFRRDVGRT